MALVVICGHPCSGKSNTAKLIAEAIRESTSSEESSSEPISVKIISETSFHLDRNQSYATVPSEKNLRGVIRSEVDRSLTVGDSSIVIVDSLNSIKGYRYELWCLARAAGVRYCVVFCDSDAADCRRWNAVRRSSGEAFYDDAVFDDLASRLERPERRNRWDSPLFEIFAGGGGSSVSEVAEYVTKKADSKTRDVKVLQPTIATRGVRPSEANSLYELDRATQEVAAALVAAQSQGPAGRVIEIGPGLPSVVVSRPVGMPELRRLRRTFIKLTGQTSLSGPAPPSDAISAKRMFVDYLNRELSGTTH